MKAIRVGADSRPARVKEHLKAASQTNAIKTVNGGALFLLAALLGTAVSGFANAEPSCMTEAEARAAHPRAHLYWHTARHCWDNIPGGQQRYDEPNPDKTPQQAPKEHPAPTPGNKKSTGLPPLGRGPGFEGEIMPREGQIALGPPIIDLSPRTPAAETQGKANTADQ